MHRNAGKWVGGDSTRPALGYDENIYGLPVIKKKKPGDRKEGLPPINQIVFSSMTLDHRARDKQEKKGEKEGLQKHQVNPYAESILVVRQ